MLVSAQKQEDFFHDRAYWIVNDDGISNKVQEVKEGDSIKGIHAYL